MNWRWFGFGLILIAPLFWWLTKGFSFDPRALPDEITGEKAPQFVLSSLEGYEVNLRDLEGGPVVINFWATWCQPCLLEHPHLQQVAAEYKSKGVNFLGILYGDTAQKARPFLKKYGSSYPTLIDEKQSVNIDYGVAGVPETFVINQKGVIVKKFAGPVSRDELKLVLDSLDNSLEIDEDAEGILEGGPFLDPPSEEETTARTQALADILRCPVCQGSSVADSRSDAAVAMKNRIREFVAQGYSDDQIVDYFVGRYGEFVLLKPKDEHQFIWLAPGAFVLLGLAVVSFQWKKKKLGSEEPKEEIQQDENLDSYRADILKELGED